MATLINHGAVLNILGNLSSMPTTGSTSTGYAHFIILVIILVNELTILLTFLLSKNCWKSTTITSWRTMQCN